MKGKGGHLVGSAQVETCVTSDREELRSPGAYISLVNRTTTLTRLALNHTPCIVQRCSNRQSAFVVPPHRCTGDHHVIDASCF